MIRYSALQHDMPADLNLHQICILSHSHSILTNTDLVTVTFI